MLLDTHVLLWFLDDNPKLLPNVKRDIEDADFVAVSIISYWEIAIKLSIQKLNLSFPFSALPDSLAQLDIRTLQLSFSDFERYAALPLHHRDPFDRILISQAIVNSLIVVSADAVFDAYPVRRMWA